MDVRLLLRGAYCHLAHTLPACCTASSRLQASASFRKLVDQHTLPPSANSPAVTRRRRYLKRKTTWLQSFTDGPYSSEHKYWSNFRVIVTGTPAAAPHAAEAAPPQPQRASHRSTDNTGGSHQREAVGYDPCFYYVNPCFYGACGYSPYGDNALAGHSYCVYDGGFGAGLTGVYCPAVDCQFIDCVSPEGLVDVAADASAVVLSGYEAAFGELSTFLEESGRAGRGNDGGGDGDGAA
jgi:hypothetical protein